MNEETFERQPVLHQVYIQSFSQMRDPRAVSSVVSCVDPVMQDATRYTVSVLTIVGRILLGIYKTRDKAH